MAGTAQAPIAKRDRVRLSIDSSVVTWVRDQTVLGTLGGDSHAVELALRRLRTIQDATRDACKREGVPFLPSAFWQLFHADIEAALPNEAGRPSRDDPGRPLGQRERFYCSVEQGLLEWVAAQTGKGGPFVNVSHAAETGLRCLRSQQRADGTTVPGSGFELDPEALWKEYRQLVGTKRGRR
jgi:hypothetical protein